MKNLEEKVRKKTNRIRIQDALILTLHLGTGVALLGMAPAAMRILKILPQPSYARIKLDARMRQARSRLMKRGVVRLTVRPDGSRAYELTDRGRAYAEALMDSETEVRAKRWDGKWRIVIFDIWEKRRDVRDTLRRRLRAFGFVQMQRSVWVTPFNCEELVSHARTELKLGPSLLYIIADEIENDSVLRTHFKLSRG